MKNTKSHYTEAKLVQLLEEKRIGRPSTFSSIIDKIQERGYVKKQNIKGTKITCKDYELSENNIEVKENKKEFGNEKGKLKIQQLGILVIEFLLKNFEPIFEYEFTETMENSLDNIEKNIDNRENVCNLCDNEIKQLIYKIKDMKKNEIYIDENHVYTTGKYGPVIKCNIDGNVTFKSVKDNIDLEKLKDGKYKLNDIENKEQIIGIYKNENIIVKNGQYGYYAKCGNKNVSLQCKDTPIEEIISLLNAEKKTSIIRKITEEISIREGKYGDYIFYKKKNSKKPLFLPLNEFIKIYGEKSYLNCDMKKLKKWLLEMYDI
tara:strand:- start:38 stop:994 length:957 start_codon:yes stop_codon:yes gene_type:complete